MKAARAERKRILAIRDAVSAAGKGEATGQTVIKLRVNETPIKRLVRLGKLSQYELTAAEDIVRAYEIQVGVAHIPDADMRTGTASAAGAADAAEARRLDLTQDYMCWRRELDGTEELRAAVAMLLDHRPAREMDAELGRRHGTAERRLIGALRHMAALRRNTPRGATGWRIDRGNRDLENAVQLARIVPRAVGC